jgi:putative glutamine amidotransferase
MSRRPLVGVLCCNEVSGRPIQAAATRFIAPLRTIADAAVVLVPAVSDPDDITALAGTLDGLLLTGSRSHVSPKRYNSAQPLAEAQRDEERDEVALRLSEAMIEVGRPVFGICRGFQEINVLFGGSLSPQVCSGHHRGSELPYDDQFDHHHAIELTPHGVLHGAAGCRRAIVNSVHEQGVDRLGAGLIVEAVASDDGLVEAISARPCGGAVMAVQWHPEWNVDECTPNRAFFDLFRSALRHEGHA